MDEELQEFLRKKDFSGAENVLLSAIKNKISSACNIEIEVLEPFGKILMRIPDEKKEYRRSVRRLLSLMEESTLNKDYIIRLVHFYNSL